jgi:hypothetical protein
MKPQGLFWYGKLLIERQHTSSQKRRVLLDKSSDSRIARRKDHCGIGHPETARAPKKALSPQSLQTRNIMNSQHKRTIVYKILSRETAYEQCQSSRRGRSKTISKRKAKQVIYTATDEAKTKFTNEHAEPQHPSFNTWTINKGAIEKITNQLFRFLVVMLFP